MTRQFGGRGAVKSADVQPIQHIGKGYLLIADRCFDLHSIIPDEQIDLFGQIIAEHLRPGNRGGI